jgi:predicted nuclease of predicted toxin-antitoxin system
MRVLLDECIPHRLRIEIDAAHQTFTVRFMGWAGIKNGELLRRMTAEGLDVLVTTDRHLHKQQNITAAGIALIVIAAKSNNVDDIAPFMPQVNEALTTIVRSEVRELRP